MTRNSGPRRPWPPPMTGAAPDSFAHHTITVRWPTIARRVLADEPWPPETVTRIQALIADLPHGEIRPLVDPGAPDLADWRALLEPLLGQPWLTIPWLTGEFYFYRLLLAATGYFQPGPGQGQDPFARQKAASLAAAAPTVAAVLPALEPETRWSPATLRRLLALALWGNQADLSLRPDGPTPDLALPAGDQGSLSADLADAQILHDDRPALLEWLAANRPVRLALIADNAGQELVGDLILVDYLLRSGSAYRVQLLLKAQPTFVSDATAADLRLTLAFLGLAGEAAAGLARRLTAARAAGRLVVDDHPFWVSPRPFWEMPVVVRQHLALADLVIGKGDANYRRLLGDRHWPFTTPFPAVAGYFPAPLLALRTVKSELAAGLAAATIRRVAAADPDWLTNGQWGLIQAVWPDGPGSVTPAAERGPRYDGGVTPLWRSCCSSSAWARPRQGRVRPTLVGLCRHRRTWGLCPGSPPTTSRSLSTRRARG